MHEPTRSETFQDRRYALKASTDENRETWVVELRKAIRAQSNTLDDPVSNTTNTEASNGVQPQSPRVQPPSPTVQPSNSNKNKNNNNHNNNKAKQTMPSLFSDDGSQTHRDDRSSNFITSGDSSNEVLLLSRRLKIVQLGEEAEADRKVRLVQLDLTSLSVLNLNSSSDPIDEFFFPLDVRQRTTTSTLMAAGRRYLVASPVAPTENKPKDKDKKSYPMEVCNSLTIIPSSLEPSL